jgi:hypothetical protein
MTDPQRRPPRGRPVVALTAVLATVLLLAPQPARGEPLPLPIVSALPLPSLLPTPLESALTELLSPVTSLIAPVESPVSSAVTQLVSPVASLVAPVQSILPLPPIVPTPRPIVPTLPPIVPTVPPILPTLPPILPTATLPPVLPTATLPPILPTATLPPVLPTATLPVPLPTATAAPSAIASATPSTGPGLVAPGETPLLAGPGVIAPGTPPAFPGIGGPLGDLVRLLGDVSVPALTGGIPTLLVVAFIAAQVLGGAAWTTLVRRGLGSWGLRVLRPAGSPEDLAGTPPER